jgi:hypothetical protein
MKPIASYVREILDESEVAFSALQEGFLNLSAYSKSIQGEVSRRARRHVAVGTIVVAISRYELDTRKKLSILPKVRIESIAVRTGLSEVTFAQNRANRAKLRVLYEEKGFEEPDLLTITSGVREISLIIPGTLRSAVLKVFKGDTPTLVVEHLASLTVRFPAKYLNTPNTIFALLRPLALNRINIVEVVSTYTELTIVVSEKHLQAAFAILSKLPTV